MSRSLLLRISLSVLLVVAASACGRGGARRMPDSGFRVAFGEHNVPAEIAPGAQVSADITITNTSPVTWPSKPDRKGLRAVNLSYHWLDRKGRVVVFDGLRTPLPRDIGPNESVNLRATIQAPEREGRYVIEVTLVQEGVAWFPEKDGEKLTLPVNVVEARREASDATGSQPLAQADSPRIREKKSVRLDKTKEPLLNKESQPTLPAERETSARTTSDAGKAKDERDKKARPWGVQVGSFPQENDAESLVRKFRDKGYEADVVAVQVKGRKWHRVLIGRLANRPEAKTLQETLKTAEKLEQSIIARR